MRAACWSDRTYHAVRQDIFSVKLAHSIDSKMIHWGISYSQPHYVPFLSILLINLIPYISVSLLIMLVS